MDDPKATILKVLGKIAEVSEDGQRIAALEKAARAKFEAGAATNNVQMMEDARAELHVLLDQTMDMIVHVAKIKSDAMSEIRK